MIFHERIGETNYFMYLCSKQNAKTLFKTNNLFPIQMMKKTLFLMALVASSLSLEAQDILVRKGGEVESVKVLEVSPTEVKYKKSNNLDGPIFIEKRSNIYSVKYQNGDVQTLNEKPEKTKKQLSVSSPYNKVKNFNHEFDLHLGNGWGLGYQIRKEFNPYIGWDIIGISNLNFITNSDNEQ